MVGGGGVEINLSVSLGWSGEKERDDDWLRGRAEVVSHEHKGMRKIVHIALTSSM